MIKITKNKSLSLLIYMNSVSEVRQLKPRKLCYWRVYTYITEIILHKKDQPIIPLISKILKKFPCPSKLGGKVLGFYGDFSETSGNFRLLMIKNWI